MLSQKVSAATSTPLLLNKHWRCCARHVPFQHSQNPSVGPHRQLSRWITQQGSNHRSDKHACAAAPSNSPMPFTVPDSEAQAVQHAAQSLKVAIQPLISQAKATNKGFAQAKKASNLFAMEIPTADNSPAATKDLAMRVAAQLFKELPALGSVTLVFAEEAAALAAARASLGSGVSRCYSLRDACRVAQLSGPLMIVAPKVADVALVEQLLQEVWTGAPATVVVNPEWSALAVPEQYKELVDSIAVVYSFLPVAIQGLLGGKEGAVVKRVEKGNPDAMPWLILYKAGDSFIQVAKTPRRPRQEDLELAFMNASAASSPLTQTVKFFKSVVDTAGTAVNRSKGKARK